MISGFFLSQPSTCAFFLMFLDTSLIGVSLKEAFLAGTGMISTLLDAAPA